MLVVTVFAVGLVVIRLAGGDLRRLDDMRLRLVPLALAAVAVQVVIISLWSGGWHLGHVLVNMATYAAVFVFLWANRSVPWLWVVGVGIACNAAAMAANGGIMPASSTAMAIANRHTGRGFANSAVVPGAHISVLGDIIPTPAWLPFHNVASVGDLLIVAGALLVVAAQAARRPSGAASVAVR